MPSTTLSRADMEAVIDAGGGVIHGGAIITDKAALPTEAELALGDPEKEDAAAEKLQAKIAALEDQLAQLTDKNAAQAADIQEIKGKTAQTGGAASPGAAA